MAGGNVFGRGVSGDAAGGGGGSVLGMGACGGCPMSTMTLKMGIERAVRQQVPEIRAVEAI